MTSNFNERFLFPILTIMYCAGLYTLGQNSPFAAWNVPLTFLDQVIPLWPKTLLIYNSLYVLLIYSFFRTPPEYKKHFLVTASTMQTLAFLVFFFFPTRIDRGLWLPHLSDQDPLIWFWKNVDGPGNCLPSLHVGTALLSAVSFTRFVKNRMTFELEIVWVLALVNIMSTLTVKQHYSLDLVAGAVVFFLSEKLVILYFTRKKILATIR